MAKSLAVIITKVPYGTEEAFAGARLALAVLVSGCKVDIKVVLIGDGTLNALVSQKPKEIGMPSNLEALKQVIEMGAEVYCVEEDLNMLVQDPKILEGIKTVSWAEARDVVQQQDLDSRNVLRWTCAFSTALSYQFFFNHRFNGRLMLEVLDRAGLARDAKWTPMKGALVETPNILFHSSPSFPLPQYADATLIREGDGMTIHIGPENGPTIPLGINRPLADQHGSAEMITGKNVIIVKGIMEREIPKDAELYVIGNAFELRRDARAFVETVLSLRKAIGYNRPIYAPGIMESSNLALLTYMGLDLFDSSLLIYQASRGKALIPEGTLPVASAPWLLSGDMDATRHNMDVAWSELQLVRHMIRIGRLRELVENRVNATPWAVAVLRIMDLEHYDSPGKVHFGRWSILLL